MNKPLATEETGVALRERLATVLPQIAANSERAELERRIPDENIALLKDIGLFRAFLPRRYGGLEVRVEEYGPCIVDLAEACTATAWVAGLLAQHVHALAMFSRQMQDELWGEGADDLVSSSIAPVGTAEAGDGGVLLSGRFGFSSGCDHATWVMLGFKHPGYEGPAARQYAVVRKSNLTVLDDWATSGMRGTGSKTLIADKVFVPDHRIDQILALNTGTSKGFGSNESPIYHAAFVPHFSIGFAAVAIGGVRKLAQLYAEKTKSRIKVYSGSQAIARSPAVMRLGKATHQNNAALAFLEKDWRGIDARCDSLQMPSPDEMSAWRTNQSFCIQMSIAAADELFNGSGGSAWFESNEMQRIWRNVHMCGAHAGTDYDTASEAYGRQLLGLPFDPTLG